MRSRLFLGVLLLLLTAVEGPVAAFQEPELSRQEQKHFLLTADVVRSQPIGKGVTDPWRLTLSDGQLTHDAGFQYMDERSATKDLGNGRTELRFVDSYRYNIAAYELAELIGMGDMVPVTVERGWLGKTGSLSWWIDAKWDENTRRAAGISPPDLNAWSEQIYRVRVLTQLVEDTDPNLGNFLITEDWKLWRIDFSRAFRLDHEIRTPASLQKCDRQVFERLERLERAQVAAAVGTTLTDGEIEALMARRDRIVEHFKELIEARGEALILY